jgi:hypothetical protein
MDRYLSKKNIFYILFSLFVITVAVYIVCRKQVEFSYLKIKNAYFWDESLNHGKGDYWLPLGVAYQTWNKPLNQWQDTKELITDLNGMEKLGANSIRADFVWGNIEVKENVYEWEHYDKLLEECKKRGIRVFPLIGYQWPPNWFPPDLKTKHPPYPPDKNNPMLKHEGLWESDIISYENPVAREKFFRFIQKVVARYSKKGERADLGAVVGAWILGNEYGYLGLWSTKYDGYDTASVNSFRAWLKNKYQSIDRLNDKWKKDNKDYYLPGYPYKNFDKVDMPAPFGYKIEAGASYLSRDKASWYDLTEWRLESIGNFVALGAKAAKQADPDHLITYSVLGIYFSIYEYQHHTEDAGTIAAQCAKAGYPLDFLSVNNYPIKSKHRETISGKFGIVRTAWSTGLPILITETGISSHNTITPISPEEQSGMISSTVIEPLINGAIGAMIFHWNDRWWEGIDYREKDFGLVDRNKQVKPSYGQIKKLFKVLNKKKIRDLFINTKKPEPDIGIYWDHDVDSLTTRYIHETIGLFGAINRNGYSPSFINRKQILDGEYKKYKAIVFPRNQKMYSDLLDKLQDMSLYTNIHANADIPGTMDEYGAYRIKDKKWAFIINRVFGLDVSHIPFDENIDDNVYPKGFFEMPASRYAYNPIPVYSPGTSLYSNVEVWKFFDSGINATDSEILARFYDSKGSPAVVVKNNGRYKTAVSLFSLGDNSLTYTNRSDFIRMIYQNKFGIKPVLDVSNHNILLTYAQTPDAGGLILSIRNLIYREESAEVSITDFDLNKEEEIFNNEDKAIVSVSNGKLYATLKPGQTILLRVWGKRKTR